MAAARSLLGFNAGETVPVSYSGGVFSSAAVRDRLQRELHALPES